jgi:UDP-N-acetylglucosamine:LPS N-acetylglucosamine transferase
MSHLLPEGEGLADRFRANFHPFYDVIRRSKAIVSKPGGCTLIDSLSSATPVVFLEPYGSAERSNGKIWEHLGFGISYTAWRETGYDASVLEQLHSNILSRTRASIDYPRAVAAELLQEATT